MKRFSAERRPIEDEVARQLCGEMLRIRRATTVPTHEDTCPHTVASDQAVSDCSDGSQQNRIVANARLDRDCLRKDLLKGSHAESFRCNSLESKSPVSTEPR